MSDLEPYAERERVKNTCYLSDFFDSLPLCEHLHVRVPDLKTNERDDFLTETCMGVIHQDLAQQADAFEITVAVKQPSSAVADWKGVRNRTLDAILWPLAGIQPDEWDTDPKPLVLKGVTVDLRDLPTRACPSTPA